MREILFRGKRIDNGEWVEGCYAYGGESHYIVVRNDLSNWSYTYQCIEVISETVGQYTGLKDRNGEKIFEGDIVEVDEVIYVVGFGHHISPCSDYPYDCGKAYGFYLENEEKFSIDEDDILDIKIIGNKFDNPELLGGENE